MDHEIFGSTLTECFFVHMASSLMQLNRRRNFADSNQRHQAIDKVFDISLIYLLRFQRMYWVIVILSYLHMPAYFSEDSCDDLVWTSTRVF